MRFIRPILAIAILVLAPFCLQGVVAADQIDQESELRKIAIIEKKLERLHKTLTDSHARALGFDSLEQLKSARPDVLNQLPVFHVGLDKLRAYDGNNPQLLLERTHSSIYPIVVPKKDKDSVIVSAVVVNADVDEKSKKINYRFGQLGLSFSIPIQVLNKVKEKLLAKDHNCDYFVISIPALSKRLLGWRREDICDFRVIDLDGELEDLLKDPSIQSAKSVFEKLAKDANNLKKYDMPRESNSIRH